MGSKTRLSSYCTKRANNGVNLAMSRRIITRLARPIGNLEMLMFLKYDYFLKGKYTQLNLTVKMED